MTLREMNLDSTLDLIILSERPHTLSDYQRGYNDGFRDAFQSMQTEIPDISASHPDQVGFLIMQRCIAGSERCTRERQRQKREFDVLRRNHASVTRRLTEVLEQYTTRRVQHNLCYQRASWPETSRGNSRKIKNSTNAALFSKKGAEYWIMNSTRPIQ